jgi:uracil-DNA glycosylase family 4
LKPAKGFTKADYWGKPVPAFGDPDPRLLVLGLAPGAHGANRSGRPFTGDAAGVWLYAALHKFGFASKPVSVSRDDGLVLTGARISNVVKCVPPANKPLPAEVQNCAPFLDDELARFRNLKVVIALGAISAGGYARWAARQGLIAKPSAIAFGHAAEYPLANGHHLILSYHCSRQNTNTGRLTVPMFESVFARAKEVVGCP